MKDKNLQQKIKRQVERAESLPQTKPLKKSRLDRSSPSLTLVHNSISTRSPLVRSFKTQEREDIDYKVVRFLCANGIPFNVSRSPYWDEMVSVISTMSGYKAPSYEKARMVLLDNEKERVRRPLINILASNAFGSMFLYAHDFSSVEKSGKNISDFLLATIENVGPSNAVQVITNNAANCKAVGHEVTKVYPHIFGSPCVVHTLNLIFKDLVNKKDQNGERLLLWFEETYFSGKRVVKYITNHSQALTIFRSHSKLELLKVAITRFASHYITLKRLIDVREALRTTVVSDAWKITKPIYKMIKFTDQEGPLIGDIYEGMDSMLGHIRDNLRGKDDLFSVVEKIVTERWEKMNVPLHSLADALTPKYYDLDYLQLPAPGGGKRIHPNQDNDILDGVLEALSKITQDEAQADIVRKQYFSFVGKKERFSTTAAIRDAKNAQVERVWSTYSYIHSVKRNRLNSTRADSLVYIHSNLRLLSRFAGSYKDGPYKKWDINPELLVVDESVVRLEELRWKNLQDGEEEPRPKNLVSQTSTSTYNRDSSQLTSFTRKSQVPRGPREPNQQVGGSLRIRGRVGERGRGQVGGRGRGQVGGRFGGRSDGPSSSNDPKGKKVF
ncbi:hypothetical protein HHK36_013513 [Tetracentron sinense]|uniref:DUF659 domain-containing protein n=1 Tax=Tetracentron sinense TaxID=13715 RepID=A0A835DEH5_TETSI|nr:hypothetical protein HHK36_013513 [Tetracentron sinense]